MEKKQSGHASLFAKVFLTKTSQLLIRQSFTPPEFCAIQYYNEFCAVQELLLFHDSNQK